jgi:hypothetical protein
MSYNLYRIIQFIYHLFQSTKEGEGIALIETYNEALAHLTFADSDIIIFSTFDDPSPQIAVCKTSLFS